MHAIVYMAVICMNVTFTVLQTLGDVAEYVPGSAWGAFEAVCTRVCMYVCVCVYIYMCICIGYWICMYVCMYT